MHQIFLKVYRLLVLERKIGITIIMPYTEKYSLKYNIKENENQFKYLY